MPRLTVILALCLLLAPAPVRAMELGQYADQVERIMTGQRVTDMMDVAMRIKEAGGSFQQDLPLPLNTTPKDPEAMRVLVGVRQFDALYAAAFGKRREAAEFIKAQNDLVMALNLKGRVDVAAVLPPELNWMVREPDKVDFKDIVAAYADNASRYKDMTASPDGFDAMTDALYGFVVEGMYVTGLHAIQAEGEPGMQRLLESMMPGLEALAELYGTFRGGDYARYVDADRFLEKGSRLGWIRQVADFIRESGGKMSIHEITAVTGFTAVQRKALQ